MIEDRPHASRREKDHTHCELDKTASCYTHSPQASKESTHHPLQSSPAQTLKNSHASGDGLVVRLSDNRQSRHHGERQRRARYRPITYPQDDVANNFHNNYSCNGNYKRLARNFHEKFKKIPSGSRIHPMTFKILPREFPRDFPDTLKQLAEKYHSTLL